MLARNVDCPTCGALTGDSCVTGKGTRSHSFHAARQALANGQKQLPLKPPMKKKEVVDSSKMVNHIALVIDSSTSMSGIIDRAREVFNQQLANIKNNVVKSGLKTFISVYSFDQSVNCFQGNVSIDNILPLTRDTYRVRAPATALRDAVGTAIADFDAHPDCERKNHSFLIVVITDGGENYSHRYSAVALPQMIRSRQQTDRWTFAFMVPEGHASLTARIMGVPIGNVQEWDQTDHGIRTAGDMINSGMDGYYKKSLLGERSTATFFADLKNVKEVDLQNLTDLSGNFLRLKVEHDSDIRDFVNRKVRDDRHVGNKINCYQQGQAYYQLTKSVLVQENKGFLIMDKTTG